MRKATTFGTVLLCCLAASAARADPIVVTTTTITTAGSFTCRTIPGCSGEGTNAVTIGSGSGSATLTFHGLTSTFDVTNARSPVFTVGEFELNASEGFIFPTHSSNPRLPMLRFALTFTQSGPVAATGTKHWQFGPGGRESLTLQMGRGYMVLPIGPASDAYSRIVYDFTPFPFTVIPGTRTPLNATVGAVPEPGTMMLLGSGLAGLVMARRRRRERDS